MTAVPAGLARRQEGQCRGLHDPGSRAEPAGGGPWGTCAHSPGRLALRGALDTSHRASHSAAARRGAHRALAVRRGIEVWAPRGSSHEIINPHLYVSTLRLQDHPYPQMHNSIDERYRRETETSLSLQPRNRCLA
ncbi:hypothetical protein NDU88_003625 [Pleurodeles waltl]|uniref:Uncharacterized protein n=1 Tax=Pleurodeles waltl TaxID=8319 RepID=A0AAV7SGG3_PLEWA|nr:hypothetical protein NDU88_003625 [Pleurodeles waltl]